MEKTICINLFAGPGAGKSTAAAALFAELKNRGESVELVREYVKSWAWANRDVKPSDDIYLLGKQAAYESRLYGKVKYIVTDSPVLLAGMYALRRGDPKQNYVNDAALGFINAHSDQVEYRNIFLNRVKDYVTEGRYETESQAKEMDDFIKSYFRIFSIPYKEYDGNDYDGILND